MNSYLNSIFHSESPQAAAISNLFVLVLCVCGIILLIVIAMVVISLVRFKHIPGQSEPKPIYGNWKLEAVWTIIPFLIILWLLSLTAQGMRQPNHSSDQMPDLLVTSHQWWWEARYPQTGVVVANEIHMPVGVRWLVGLESADVIHDFWVPRLAPKMDAVPGHPNRFWLEADTPGSYLGTCAEYCGAQHAQMHFLIIAQSPFDFETWQAQQKKPANQALSGSSLEGSRLFQQMTCASCHTINGTQAKGKTAPDLTHIASRSTLGAVVLLNTHENLAQWLKDPQSIKPEALMPNLKLTNSQIDRLESYLESLK
jgi:cytochrome c oxidase subunit II